MAKTKTKPAAPVVDDIEDDELEELDEDEVEDTPAKSKKGGAPEVAFGASDLAKLVSEKTGKKLDAKNLRVLLRKMARDGRLDRKVEQGNRTRYSWSGPNDPEVKAILKALDDGELEKDKAEKLQALKDRKAKTDAKKNKKKAAPVVEDDEDDDFEDDDE